MVEHTTHNRVVGGSIPPAAIPPPAGARVLVALSGGPDSTALLLWLLAAGRDVAAAHFDHGLRGGSEADSEHVARLCAGLGVELVSGRRDRPLPRGSLQAGARTLRYGFLDGALAATGRDLVALGHTADDVVEGALLHLLRGAGPAGLRGMPERRGHFIRPLLAVWRADIDAYLAGAGVRVLADPSNLDSARFARARVRHQLLPALELARPGVGLRIRAAAAAAAGLSARLEQAARRALAAGDLAVAPRAVRLEAYRLLYGRAPALGRRHLEAMDRLLLAGATGAGLDLPGGLRFRVHAGRPAAVSIGPAVIVPGPLPRLKARACAGCGDPDAVHLRPGLRLAVGRRRPGLRMRPAGGRGSRKLQDLLVDARVPRHLRDSLPLVFGDGRLAWVPGVAVAAGAVAPGGVPGVHVNLEGWPRRGGSISRTIP